MGDDKTTCLKHFIEILFVYFLFVSVKYDSGNTTSNILMIDKTNEKVINLIKNRLHTSHV